MKLSNTLLVAGVICGAAAAMAQPAADREFETLQVIAQPRTPSGAALTDAQRETERRQQLAAFILAADKAKDFVQQHPDHPKAAEARKIEAQSLMRAVQEGAAEYEPRALRAARDYRWDKTNASRDRFDIAAFIRQLEVWKENHGESREDMLASHEQAAMDLYGEFPDEPRVYNLFLGIARNAMPTKARAVANQVLLMPAPASAKDEARDIIARIDSVGKPLDAEWLDEAGNAHAVRDYRGKLVVFYVWSTWAGAADPGQKIKTSLPAGATVVSVNVDSDVAAAKNSRSKWGIDGIAYYDAAGMNSSLPRQLRVIKVPGFYVINARGEFVGGGSPEQLSSLLAQASK